MPYIPVDFTEGVAATIRSTREYQAGAAFGVPLEARASHSKAMADACLECLSEMFEELEIARRAATLALGVVFVIAAVAAIPRR